MKNSKRLLSLLLTLVLVFSLLPKAAVTAEAATSVPQEMTDKGFRASVSIVCDDGHADTSHTATALTITNFSFSKGNPNGYYLTISGSFSYICNDITHIKSFSNMNVWFPGCSSGYTNKTDYIRLNNGSDTLMSNYALVWLRRSAGHQVTNGYTEVGDRHTANCIVCGAVDEACSGGTATCLREAVCAYCGGTYGTKDPNHHDTTETYARNERDDIFQHIVRYSCCDARVDPYRGENHTESIAPTCEHGPYCAVCDSYYNEGLKLGHTWATIYSRNATSHWNRCLNSGCEEKQSLNKHTWSAYYAEGSKHYRKCTVCSYEDAHTPNWKDATCMAPKTCKICSLTKGDVDLTKHSWGKWSWDEGTVTHTRVCSRSGNHKDTANCDYSAATCLSASVCSDCGHQYAAQLTHAYHYTASGNTITETCTNGCTHTATATLEAENSYSFIGSKIEPVVVNYSENWQGPEDLSVSYADQDTINVGQVTATVSCGDATAEKSYDILAADMTVSTADYNNTYDGKSHGIGLEVTAPGSTPIITYSLTGEDGSYSTTVPVFTDVTETTTVYYKVEASNYHSVSGSQTVTITKASLTVAADDATIAYNDPIPEYTVTYSGFVNGETEDVLSGMLAFDCAYAVGSAVDTYPIAPSGLTSENYEITFESGTLTVEKARGLATVTIEDWTFGETAKTPISETSTNQGMTPVYTYAVKGEESYSATVPASAGSYTVKVTYAATESYTEAVATADFTVEQATIAPEWLQTAPVKFVYNGARQVPAVTVNGGEVYGTLIRDTDYTVSYTDSKGAEVAEPTNADIYTLMVTGKGNYTGVITVEFEIAAKQLREDGVTLTADLTYNGEAQEPAIAVKDGDTELSRTSDYTVSYEKVNENSSATPVQGAPVDAGSYNAIITGKGNYDGEIRKPFEIKPNASIDITPAEPEDEVYTGEEIQPAIQITGVKLTELEKDKDYTIVYENNINAGEAKITITGIGNYAGAKKEMTFTIIAKELTEANVTIDETVLAHEEGKTTVPEVTVKDGSKTLVAGTDYVIAYLDEAGKKVDAPSAIGTYKVQVIGIADQSEDGSGNYSGTVSKTFVIVDVTDPEITGITGGKTYYTTQKATATDANLASVTKNGIAITPVVDSGTEVTLEGDVSATYTVVAADMAENESTITITMKPISTLNDSIENLTVENVELSDKDAIQTVLNAVKHIRENECGNATKAEKDALDAIISKCNDLLKVITDVEAAIAKINAMPNSSKTDPDDETAIAAYDAAKAAYDALSAHGKELVGKENKGKLGAMRKALTDYDIIKGHKFSYTRGSGKTFTITANGHIGKFTGLKIDGKLLDSKHYTVKSGSTIVTLRNRYLDRLSDGKHTIEFIYTDGTTGGDHYFRIFTNNGIPFTSDNSHIMLLGGIMMTSFLALAVLMLNKKKFWQK